jgi:hypothetical protein
MASRYGNLRHGVVGIEQVVGQAVDDSAPMDG